MSTPFAQLWCLDFEFTRNDGAPGLVEPICLAAHEIISGRQISVWQDEMFDMERRL